MRVLVSTTMLLVTTRRSGLLVYMNKHWQMHLSIHCLRIHILFGTGSCVGTLCVHMNYMYAYK